jgi:hypothetical protein
MHSFESASPINHQLQCISKANTSTTAQTNDSPRPAKISNYAPKHLSPPSLLGRKVARYASASSIINHQLQSIPKATISGTAQTSIPLVR